MISPTWNDEFELPEGSHSVSYIQDHIDYIMKEHKKLPTNPPACSYLHQRG